MRVTMQTGGDGHLRASERSKYDRGGSTDPAPWWVLLEFTVEGGPIASRGMVAVLLESGGVAALVMGSCLMET